MRLGLIVCATLCAAPAGAGVPEAVTEHILPAFDGFATAATGLADAARSDCRAEAVRPAYQAAFDAWMGIADLRLGPSETGALSIAFWPDGRGATPRTLSTLIAAQDPIAEDTTAYAEVSIAARGFFALDMLLYDPGLSGYAPGDYSCTLVRAVTADLGLQAQALRSAWQGRFAQTLTDAGSPGNTTYLTGDEALRTLYTQLLAGLEFTADTRLGNPLGTYDRPRPSRAEAWRSGRSLRNVQISAQAAVALARPLAGFDLPLTETALAKVAVAAAKVGDPAFQDIDDPRQRLRVEVLQTSVNGLRAAIAVEIGTALGIAPGFNSQDGD